MKTLPGPGVLSQSPGYNRKNQTFADIGSSVVMTWAHVKAFMMLTVREVNWGSLANCRGDHLVCVWSIIDVCINKASSSFCSGYTGSLQVTNAHVLTSLKVSLFKNPDDGWQLRWLLTFIAVMGRVSADRGWCQGGLMLASEGCGVWSPLYVDSDTQCSTHGDPSSVMSAARVTASQRVTHEQGRTNWRNE